MELNIGSNLIRNTSGVLNVEGHEQIYLEIGERDRQLLLTMDIYDTDGTHVAKLRRNAWVFNNHDRYEITTHPSSLRLTDTLTGEVVVEANVVDPNHIEMLNGRFFTHRGHLLEITPQFWRIAGGLTMSGNVFDNVGGAVALG